jgi:hypothetical protein
VYVGRFETETREVFIKLVRVEFAFDVQRYNRIRQNSNENKSKNYLHNQR